MMSALALLALALALCGTTNALTLEEAQAMPDPDKYILYDTAPYNLGMQAGLALFLTYGMLTSLVTMLSIVIRLLVKTGAVSPRKQRT